MSLLLLCWPITLDRTVILERGSTEEQAHTVLLELMCLVIC